MSDWQELFFSLETKAVCVDTCLMYVELINLDICVYSETHRPNNIMIAIFRLMSSEADLIFHKCNIKQSLMPNVVYVEKTMIFIISLNTFSRTCAKQKPPWGSGGGGVKSRMCPPYPQRVVKGDLLGRCVGSTVWKGWSRVCDWTGKLKNPTKCLWRWEPDRRSNYYFFSPPAHLCAVTCMAEILLFVTLNNQFTSPHAKQKRRTEGCSKLKSPETRQVQERLVSTLEHMHVLKRDRTGCSEE